MSTVIVRGERAQAYRDYADLDENVGTALPSYRALAQSEPDKLDVATLAVACKEQVRFGPQATAIFIACLEREDLECDDHRISFETLRPGIEAKPAGRTIITACESKSCTSALAEALCLLFIAAHQHLFEIDDGTEPLLDEDEGEPDGDDLDEPPPGYGEV